MDQDLISVVLRLHTVEGNALGFLSHALLSLAAGTYRPVEALIITQQFTPQETERVRSVADSFIWEGHPSPRILNYQPIAAGDHRSALLNLGMRSASGRYLAILDYDDYVYEHAYETLISRLKKTNRAAAFGGCMVAHLTTSSHGFVVTEKIPRWAGSVEEDFFEDNIFPIHTFVIDRERLGARLPAFDETLTRLEDYDFLLRLRAVTPFDTVCINKILFEYAIRMDGTNTVVHDGDHPPGPNKDAWESSRKAILPLRRKLFALKGRPSCVLDENTGKPVLYPASHLTQTLSALTQ